MADHENVSEAILYHRNYKRYWYILMTWHGEFEESGFYEKKHQRLLENRLFWHRFIFDYLSEKSKKHLKDNNIYSPDQEKPFSDDEKLIVKNELEKKLYDRYGTRIALNERWSQIEPATFFRHQKITPIGIMFDELSFSQAINFEFYVFPGMVLFNNCQVDYLNLANAIFQKEVSFAGTTFNGRTCFKHTIFRGAAMFNEATFKKPVTFRDASFEEITSFKQVKFDEDASFKGTGFKDVTDFQGGYFAKEVDFKNSIFKSTTNFSDRKFSSPPLFHGSEMHVDTIWSSDVNYWPKSEAIKEDPKKAERAWSTLKYHMNKVMRHDYEHMFFTKELEAKKIINGGSVLLDTYDFFSNYGWSVSRPLKWLVFVSWMSLLIYSIILHFELPENYSGFASECWKKAAKFSLGNTFPFLPFWKIAYADSTSMSKVVFGGVQTLFSLLMWFLAGLGLRNRFRLK